jgi:hypothetical protein
MYAVDRVRITDRDRELLEFAAQHRMVLSSHVQVLLGVSYGAATTRLRALVRAGLLGSRAFFDRQPRSYWITRAGLRAAGSELPPPRVDLRSYRHDVGVAWLWLAARRGAFGSLTRVVSEREMRSHDAIETLAASGAPQPFAVRLGGVGAGGRERLHYPDVLLMGPGGRRVAVELELTSKSRPRRERIVAGYAADRRFEAVLYLVDSRAVGRAVRSSAERLGVSDRVHVQLVRWGDNGPRSGGERVRTADRVTQLTR